MPGSKRVSRSTASSLERATIRCSVSTAERVPFRQVRRLLFAVAFNLGNILRRLALPPSVRHGSLTPRTWRAQRGYQEPCQQPLLASSFLQSGPGEVPPRTDVVVP